MLDVPAPLLMNVKIGILALTVGNSLVPPYPIHLESKSVSHDKQQQDKTLSSLIGLDHQIKRHYTHNRRLFRTATYHPMGWF